MGSLAFSSYVEDEGQVQFTDTSGNVAVNEGLPDSLLPQGRGKAMPSGSVKVVASCKIKGSFNIGSTGRKRV